MTTVVVTSAAGGVGRPLVRNLSSSGATVRALVKNTAQADIARQDGATEFCVGDLRDRATLADGLRGADAIYHAAPTQIIDEYPIAEELVEIGHDVSLKHVVFHSVIHPDIAELPHHQQKERVEKLLRDSGLAVTVLRPSHYMQNYLELWEFIQGGLMPYPVSPTSVMGVVDVEDVAAAAAAVLTRPDDHVGKTYDLSTEELDRNAMARAFTGALGHPVTAIRLPPDTLANPLSAAASLTKGLIGALPTTSPPRALHLLRGIAQSWNARGIRSWPREAQQNYVQMMTYYDQHGLPAGDRDHLPALLGRAPTSYTEFAQHEASRRLHPFRH